MQSISEKYNKSVAQVVLLWLIQRGVIVIPKLVRKERIVENFNVFDFELTTEDIKAIASLDTGTSLFFDHHNREMVKRLGNTKF